MPTLVCFHAHPDDEAIATGGLMAQTKAAGGRVVLVVATRGERGEPQPGVLGEGEALWERRIPETFAAAEVLGVDRVEFLGYVDSGMMGEPSNDFPYSFWQADLEQAANRLAAILAEEEADVLTVYDDNGGYGHPDHIQVHRVGTRAAELADVPRVLQATMNRDQIRRAMAEQAIALAEEAADGADVPEPDDNFGKPEAELTHGLDVTAETGLKRKAMAAHASQISPESWFLQLDDEMFSVAFGTEWFIESGKSRGQGEEMRASVW
ncbi:MAG: GlcNAc-PI de-N-acetylase [Actinomycetia bacterium]|nr:GlcNAc-PI de-N-acetylase [Actinomycetes bacterium]